MNLSFDTGTLLLLVAAIVAMLTHRLRIPYTVGLVAAGIGLAFMPFAPVISLTKELIFTALLPPLIFEAAFHLHWKESEEIIAISFAVVAFSIFVQGMTMKPLLRRTGDLR